MMRFSTLPTSASDGVNVGMFAFVESDMSRSTPIRLYSAMAPKSVVMPSMGVWSSLKSPVCSTLPAGLFRKMPTEPGMLWFTAKKFAVKQPILMLWPGLISISFAFLT